MTADQTLPQTSAAAATFAIDRFEWAAPDRIEIAGVWSGVRGRRFIRPTLMVTGAGESKRLLAVLEHKPWAADDGQEWIAAFPWEGAPEKLDSVQMNVAPGIDLALPPPRMRPGKPRRFPRHVVSHDGSRDGDQPTEKTDSAAVAGDAVDADRGRAEVAELSADRDRLRDELAAAREQVRSLRAEIEAARQERERAVADARASERGAATTMLAQGAELRAAVERQRELAYAARDAAEHARDDATAARERALADRQGALEARKQAERDRDAALAERDRAVKERNRAVALREDALRERDQAHEERDQANRERDEIVSLHERGLPLKQPKPRFLPEPPPAASELEVWLPRGVAVGILLLFAVIVLRLFAGA